MTRTLTLEQAAAMLNTTAERTSQCIQNQGLPAARVGRAYVLIDDDIIDWLRKQYVQPTRGTGCGSTNASQAVSGGSILGPAARALDAALAPSTRPRRKSTPPRLRQVSGARPD
jgi:excisionase family DNA binding protein